LEASLTQTIDIETPELVVLSYTVAGIGSRAYAALIDAALCVLGFVAIIVGYAVFMRSAGGVVRGFAVPWMIALIVLAQFVVLWGYYVLFEALADGQTPGKRSQRLRVVRDGGLSVTFGASAVRNLVRIIDMQPGLLYGVGLTSLLVNAQGKRLGDIAAGTMVVKEELITQPVTDSAPDTAPNDGQPAILHAALTDAEYEVLDRFWQRRMELEMTRRNAFANQLAARFAVVLADRDPGRPMMVQLAQLHASEKTARARGVAARHDTGAARERHAIIAANAPRWSAFAANVATAQSGGLKTLGEQGVRKFVREYRDLTADLARLRTATRGREATEVFYLNRLVASAHNLIYRRRSLPLRSVGRFFFHEAPGEIRRSALPILLAATLLALPAGVTCTAIVRDPSVARTLVGPEMLDRAEHGVESAQHGEGYIKDPQLFRPVMATRIIANNVQVAFLAFAFGITAGLFTTWILLANGISLGAVFGLYASKGIGVLLLAFVAPHGVLELSAIAISGGAGFLLAAGMLVPGNRTRRTALIENGRRAITLVGGASLMLIVAGMLEGFVSPIEWWPLEGKLAVSGVTALLLYAYIRLGAGRHGARPAVRSLLAPSVPDTD